MQDDLMEQVAAAVINGRFSDLAKLSDRLAANAAARFQELQQTIGLLAWHNHPAHLRKLLHAAWPTVRNAPDMRPAAKNRFAAQATDFLIYAYLEEQRPLQLATAVADLLPRVQVYTNVDAGGLAPYLAYMAGLTRQQWTMANFTFSRSDEAAAQRAAANLAALMIEFVAAARAEEDVPLGQGALVREQLPLYFSMRRTGQLVVRQPIADLMQGKRPFPQLNPEEPLHPLCPDATTLKRYFAHLLHFARPQPYRAAALYQLIPSWLRFLAARSLIDAAQQQKTIADLQPLLADLSTQWADHPDGTLVAALESAWTSKI